MPTAYISGKEKLLESKLSLLLFTETPDFVGHYLAQKKRPSGRFLVAGRRIELRTS